MRRRRADRAVLTTLPREGLLLFRPLQPEDRDALRSGFQQLSSQSRYRRFLRPVSELSEQELDRFADVDGEFHVAWAALLRPGENEIGVGVARFIRDRDDPAIAEVAITVIDEYQGRGIGRALLWLAVRSAVRRGVRTFRAFVQPENRRIVHLLSSFGLVSRIAGGRDAVIISLPESNREFSSLPVPELLAPHMQPAWWRRFVR